MGKKKQSSTLGRAMIKDRFKSGQRHHGHSQMHTTDLDDGYNWNKINLKSVTEENSLDEFLSTAELAGREFLAEKMNYQIVTEKVAIGLLTEDEEKKVNELQESHRTMLKIPRRPEWDENTTAEELDQNERESFLEWRRNLAKLQEIDGIVMTPFERNLQFWRQLWRVIERSNILVQIVDARNPLLFRCEDLESYVKEVGADKLNMLLINKADLLSEEQRETWVKYFDSISLRVVFWSAVLEMERIKQESRADGADSSDNDDDDNTDDDDGDDDSASGDDDDDIEEEEQEDENISMEDKAASIQNSSGLNASSSDTKNSISETHEKDQHDELEDDEEGANDNDNDNDDDDDDDDHHHHHQWTDVDWTDVDSEESDSSLKADNVSKTSKSLKTSATKKSSVTFKVSSTKKSADDKKSVQQFAKKPEPAQQAAQKVDCGVKVVKSGNTAEKSCVIRNVSKVVSGPELIEIFRSLRHSAGVEDDEDLLTVGLVGYPNVGKSSTVNALLQTKKVAVSATPGRTKHFQTLYLDESLMLCDCPGLVMPTFVTTKAEMITNGILPIDQMRDYIPPVSLVCKSVDRDTLETVYGIMLPLPGEGEDPLRCPNFQELLTCHASVRGFMTHKGIPDYQRSSRHILKDYVNGKLLYCYPPPGLTAEEFKSSSHTSNKQRKQKSLEDNTISGKEKQPVSSVDEKFFSQTQGGAGSRGVGGVQNFTRRAGFMSHHSSSATEIDDRGSSTSSLNAKPWKKHNKVNKKEKLRRVYGHLDA